MNTAPSSECGRKLDNRCFCASGVIMRLASCKYRRKLTNTKRQKLTNQLRKKYLVYKRVNDNMQ